MKQRIIIPVITPGDVGSLPPHSATSTEVFLWVKGWCSKYVFPVDSLKHVQEFNGVALYASFPSHLMSMLKEMGLTGDQVKKALRLCGFIIAARRQLEAVPDEDGLQDAATNMTSSEVPAKTDINASRSATLEAISEPSESLLEVKVEYNIAFADEATTPSRRVKAQSPPTLLLPPPALPPPKKSTAQTAALGTDDNKELEIKAERDSVDLEDIGSFGELSIVSGCGSGQIEYPGDIDEEYELWEENDLIYDEEFNRTMFDEYEEMTPLEGCQEWGYVPFNDTLYAAGHQEDSDIVQSDDDGYNVDVIFDSILAQTVMDEDSNEDADDEQSEDDQIKDEPSENEGIKEELSEDHEELLDHIEKLRRDRWRSGRYQDFMGEGIAEDTASNGHEEYARDEDEGQRDIQTSPMQSGTRTNRYTSHQDFSREGSSDEQKIEVRDNKENEEQARKHGRSKMTSIRSRRVKLTEKEQSLEVPVHGHEKCVVEGVLYDLFADF